MKFFASMTLLLVGVLSMAASCVDISVHDLQSMDWDEDYKFTTTVEQSLDFANRSALILENPAGHIEIEGWDQSTIQFTATISAKTQKTLDGIEIKIDESTNKATLKATHESRRFQSWRVDFVIKVPQNIDLSVDQGAGKIDIANFTGGLTTDLGAGQVNVENVSVPELEVDIGAGEANIITFEGRELSVDIGAGQLNFEPQNSTMFDLIDVDVSTGEVNLLGVEAKQIKAEVGMGQINLKLYPTGSYTIDADAGIGHISIRRFDVMSLEQSGFIGQSARAILGNGQGDIKLEVGTGDIHVRPWEQ